MIPTLAILYAAEQGRAGLAPLVAAQVTPAAALAFLAILMLFIPCAATVAAIRSETESWAWTGYSVILPAGISFGVAVGIYQAARLLGIGV